MVGRHPESDLTVDANFSAVSRAHLVLEWDGEQQFRMMDLSTRGTWLREKVLAKLSAVARPEDLLEPMMD
jgi:pSer/pThr/pTyr-binding forkhead associated (FHA) protein